MSRNLRYGLIAAGVALFVALIASIPFMVPTTSLRGEIENRVTQATGRAFHINGPLTFSFFPTVGLVAHDVTLVNAPGGHAPYILRVASMRLAVELIPLLSRQIDVTQVVLDRPQIALEVAADGTANWTLVRAHTEASGLHVPANTTFAGVTVRGAEVSYDNEKLGIHRVITSFDATVALTQLGLPVSAQGAFTHQGKRFTFSSKIATLKTLLAGQATQTDVTLASDFVQATFKGTVSSDGTATGFGTLATPSLRALEAWLGRPVSAGDGLNALTASANVAAKDRNVSLTNIRARLDAMTITGALDANLRIKVPEVDGTLAIDRIDLNTYLKLGNGHAPEARPRGPPSGRWGKQPISFNLIKLINGNLTLNTGGLTIRHMQLGHTTLVLALRDGVMRAHLDPLTLYGGSGKADLEADARGPVPAFRNTLTFWRIAMRPFLADAIGVDKIDGTGTISLDVAAQGDSPDAIMRTLSGKGAVAIAHGRVRGVDMGQVARTVETILSAGATGESAATEFDSFSGSFSIANGVLWNGDLKLLSPFIHMTGQGHLDLGNQTIVYRIEPKAALGGRMDILEIGVPFNISGNWSHLRYSPDLAAAVTGLVKSVLGKGAAPLTGLLNGLTNSQQHGTTPPRKKKTVGDRLKQMFGIH